MKNFNQNHLQFMCDYIEETKNILDLIDKNDLQTLIDELDSFKTWNSRLFILGVGGSAATASHAVNDFRKLCGIETYAPTDNVSELTARTNDEGFENCFAEWLKGSHLSEFDAILVLSVGGGNQEKNVSMNIVKAIDYAKEVGASVFGIVGRDGGYTKQKADVCVVIPTVSSEKITPNVEGICSVLLHLIVSHPSLKVNLTKWETVK